MFGLRWLDECWRCAHGSFNHDYTRTLTTITQSILYILYEISLNCARPTSYFMCTSHTPITITVATECTILTTCRRSQEKKKANSRSIKWDVIKDEHKNEIEKIWSSTVTHQFLCKSRSNTLFASTTSHICAAKSFIRVITLILKLSPPRISVLNFVEIKFSAYINKQRWIGKL